MKRIIEKTLGVFCLVVAAVCIYAGVYDHNWGRYDFNMIDGPQVLAGIVALTVGYCFLDK